MKIRINHILHNTPKNPTFVSWLTTIFYAKSEKPARYTCYTYEKILILFSRIFFVFKMIRMQRNTIPFISLFYFTFEFRKKLAAFQRIQLLRNIRHMTCWHHVRNTVSERRLELCNRIFLLWHLYRREHYHSKTTAVFSEQVGGSCDEIQEFKKCNFVTFHKVHRPDQWDGINIGRPLFHVWSHTGHWRTETGAKTKTMLRNNGENRCKTGRDVWIQVESLVPYTPQVVHSCVAKLQRIFVKKSSDEKKGLRVCFRCCSLEHLRILFKIRIFQ